MDDADPVAGYLYASDADHERNETVCVIVGRANLSNGFGIEPAFVVRFADGCLRDVLAQQLSPWYPT